MVNAKHSEPPADLPEDDEDDEPQVKKHHRFRVSMRTKAIAFEGTADVFGDGTQEDAEHYLRAMLAHKASPLRVEPIKGKTIVVEADRG